MCLILPKVRLNVKERLLRQLRQCRDAGFANPLAHHYQSAEWSRVPIRSAEVSEFITRRFYRVAKRFRCYQEAGLLDAREDNGDQKLNESLPEGVVRGGAWFAAELWLAAADLDSGIAGGNHVRQTAVRIAVDDDEPRLWPWCRHAAADRDRAYAALGRQRPRRAFEPDSHAVCRRCRTGMSPFMKTKWMCI